MTEINVTSPTGLQEINRFDGVRLEGKIWDAIEARLPDRTDAGPRASTLERPGARDGSVCGA